METLRNERTAARRRRRKGANVGFLLTTLAIGIGLTGTALLCNSVFAAANTSTPSTDSRVAGPSLRLSESSASPIDTKAVALNNADLAALESVITDVSSPAPTDAEKQLWNMILVNRDNPVPADFSPSLVEVGNGYRVDERIAEPLKAMLSAAKLEGLSPIICSAYRSVEKQQQLYDNQIAQQVGLGFGKVEAEERAGTIVAYPGTSEHNTGLAVDIVSLRNQMLDESQAKTAEAKWLAAHCAEYGFILRYPVEKTEITGIIYEPWHFRYVGSDAAKEIMEQGVCLEEYLTPIIK